MQKLIECKRENNDILAAELTDITATIDAAAETTTSSVLLPSQCLSATNLRDSWRIDHDGRNLKPGGLFSRNGYACDIRNRLQWFRLSGAAGK